MFYWHVIPSLQSAILNTTVTFKESDELNQHTQKIPGVVQLNNISNKDIYILKISINKIIKILYLSSHGTNGKIKSIESFVISRPQPSEDKSFLSVNVSISFLIVGFWEGIELTSLDISQRLEYNKISSCSDFILSCKNCNNKIAQFTNPNPIQLPLTNSLTDIFCSECEGSTPCLVDKTPLINELFIDIDYYIINIGNLVLYNLADTNCDSCSKLYNNYSSLTYKPTVVDVEEELSPGSLNIQKIKLYKGEFGFFGDNYAYYKYKFEFINPLIPFNHIVKSSIKELNSSDPDKEISLIITSRDIYLLPLFDPVIEFQPSSGNKPDYADYENSFLENQEVIISARKKFNNTIPIVGKRVLWKLGPPPTNIHFTTSLSKVSFNYLLDNLIKFTIHDSDSDHCTLKPSVIPI